VLYHLDVSIHLQLARYDCNLQTTGSLVKVHLKSLCSFQI